MNNFIIFGSGFLARYIAKHFIDLNYNVTVIYNKHSILDLPKANQIPRNSINIIQTILNIKPEYILFASGDAFVADNVNIQDSVAKNLTPTLETLEDIYKHIGNVGFIKKIVIIGSAAEYGKKNYNPIPETFATHPTSIYGLTKIFLYNTSMYYVEKGLPIVYSRQFNCIGPHQRDVFVLSSFSKQVALIERKLQQPKIHVGNILSERDFIDVRDAAHAYYILFNQGIAGQVYNVATGISVQVKQLLDILIEMTEYKESQIEICETKKEALSINTLSDKLLADNLKLRNLGFKPQYSLANTVNDTLNYWRNHV